MKKCLWLIVLGIVVLSAGFVLAEGPMPGMMGDEMGGMKKDAGKMDEEMMEHGMMMKKMMGMKMMTHKEIVATSDGGIVILSGNKLSKYDKNLNLVKEVELNTEADKGGMMGKCPVCPMRKGGMKQEPADAKGQDATDHSAHH